MKKLLLASTALVASAGIASAEVLVSGSAEMGIFGGDSVDADDFGSSIDSQFHTDINVVFSMAGETDGGLTFGAEVDLDTVTDDSFGAFTGELAGEDTSIFISGSLGTLTMGDTDGAVDFVMQEAIIGASIIDDNEHLGYNGNNQLDGTYDGQIARYDYTIAGFSVAVSAEIDDDDDNFADLEAVNDPDGIAVGERFENFTNDIENEVRSIENDTVLGIGVRYEGDFGGSNFGAGLGYQRAGMGNLEDTDGDGVFDDTNDFDTSALGASLDFAMENGFQAVINYTSYDNVFRTELGGVGSSDDGLTDETVVINGFSLDSHYGLAVGYEIAGVLVAANYGEFDFQEGKVDGYSLIANYDLGGGAELQAGYGRSSFDLDEGTFEGELAEDSASTFSFGVAMSF